MGSSTETVSGYVDAKASLPLYPTLFPFVLTVVSCRLLPESVLYPMVVMIVGKQEDLTSVYIQEKVAQRGIETLMFNTTLFPYQHKLTYDIDAPANGSVRQWPETRAIAFSEIKGVFRRWSDGVKVPDSEQDPLRWRLVYRNLESAVNCFFRSLDSAIWVNTAQATDEHRLKVNLLQTLRQQGVRVPDTLVTCQPEDFRHFYQKWDGNIIMKPVLGWADTERVTAEHCSDEALKLLENMPVKLQEFIPGTDIRIYLIKDELFPVEIQSKTVDFRNDPYAPRVPITLPDAVAQTCFQIAQTLGLVYAGIDMRRTPAGEYVFFEANPTPVFLYDEEASGYPISDCLVDLLVSRC